MSSKRGNREQSILHVSLHDTLAGINFHFTSPDLSISGTYAADTLDYFKQLGNIERDFLGSAALLVVAGLFSPSSIVVEWSSKAIIAPEFRELLQILYDVQAYCAKNEPFSPFINFEDNKDLKEGVQISTVPVKNRISGRNYLQLFSGGIDSTYSMIRLINEDKKPIALFLAANADTVELEWNAAKKIASKIGVELIRCDVIIDGLPFRGADKDHWPKFGQFPYYNSIPHGRDIFSATVGAIIAESYGIDCVAFGQEKESREKAVTYFGRRVFRHDVESKEGSRILKSWLRRCFGVGLQLESPIEEFTIEQIRLDMINQYTDLFAETQSCFWERLCGQCVKCVSLYILQRSTGMNIFFFQKNPLADPSNGELADAVLSTLPDNEIGYGAQIRDGIRQIIAKGNYSAEDYWISRALDNPDFLSDDDIAQVSTSQLLRHP